MELLFIGLLLFTSVVGVAVIIDRSFALRWTRVLPPQVLAALSACRDGRDLAALREACQRKPSAISRLILVAAEHLAWPKEENVETIQNHARREIVGLERGLVVLEIVVGVAPLLGLVGTVFGLMVLFGDLGRLGMSDSSALATGIGVILNSTLLGLLVAIPSLVAWNYFNRKVETMAVEMESLCTEFIRRQYREEGARS